MYSKISVVVKSIREVKKIQKTQHKRFYLLVITLIFVLATTGAVSAASNTTNTSQSSPDPKLYDHDNNLVNSYSSIQDAYNDAAVGSATKMDTIELEAGGTFNLTNFEIKKNLIFTAENGGTTTINGFNHRLVHIYPGFTVYFYNITFQNGHAPDGTLLYPEGSNGGAIWNQGALYLVNCTLKNNRAGDGGSFTYGGAGGDGGAIWNQGTLTMTGSALYNNRAGHGTKGVLITHSNGFNGGNGGAIYSTGTLTITDSNLYNNHAGNGGNGVILGTGGDGGSGGAIYGTEDMTITGTQIHDNYAGNAGAGGTEVIVGGTGGSGGNGGGIFYSGTGTAIIFSSQINSNTAGNGGSGASGNLGGYAGHTGGSGGSGGAIYNAGHLEITNTTIANNTAGNGGVGGNGGTAIRGIILPNTGGSGGKGGQGGHAGGIFNSNYLMITESAVSANHAGNGGSGGKGGTGSDRGIILPSGNGGNGGNGGNAGSGAGIYHSGSTLGVISNNLANNLLGTPGNGGAKGSKGSGSGGSDGNPGVTGSNGSGGALFASKSTHSIHFNRILGNTSPDIVASSGVSVDAENNWWGSNLDPSSRVSGDVDYSPWIMLRISADPESIRYLGTSNITSDLTWNTLDGVNPYQQPSGGYIPDGVPVAFGVQTGPGNVDPTDSATNGGRSNSTYNGTGVGTATIYTQVDNETQIINVTINKANTTLTVNPSSGIYKGSTNLSTTLTDEYGDAIANEEVEFYVNGSLVGTGTTNSSGFVSMAYSPILLNPTGGPYTIEAKFPGNDNFNATTGLNNLTVSKASSTLTVNPSSGVYRGSTNLSATLVDQYGGAVVGVNVDFYVNGSLVGTANTNNSGIASVTFVPILLNPTGSPYNITAEFAGNSYYNGTTGSNNLTVNKANSNLTVVTASGTYKGSALLQAVLVNQYGDVVAGVNVDFYVNGTFVGTGTTNSNGIASVTFVPILLNPTGSPYNITAEFSGNDYYNGDNSTNQLTVNKANSILVTNAASGVYNGSTILSATLVDGNGSGMAGQTVNFYVNGSLVGSGITNSNGFISVIYKPLNLNPAGNPYTITAKFAGNNYYNTSNSTNKLTVTKANTILQVKNVTGNPGQTVKLTATLKDNYNKPLSGYKVTFKVNGVNVGYGYTNTSGIATKNYSIKLKGGYYTINASFAGNSYYNTSNGKGTLKIPTANLYVNGLTSNSKPTVGNKITLTFKVGNKGPETAEKTVFHLKLPVGLDYVSMRFNQGKASYNPSTRNITWSLDKVVVGDLYLWLNLKVAKAGKYVIKPTITTVTYDPNIKIQSITINAKNASNNNHNHNTNNGTIGMQNTGMPVGTLLLALIMVFAGILTTKRK